MATTENYTVIERDRYKSSYDKLLKKHYKRNKKARNEFEELVDTFKDALKVNPFDVGIPSPEGFPEGARTENLLFMKKRWKRLPGLSGASRFGRLIFIIHEPSKTVFLDWIYTHQEFEKRPPEKDLIKDINSIQEEISVY